AKEETVNTALHSEPSDTSVEELTKLQKDAEDLIQKQHVQTEIEEVVHSNVKTEEDNKNFSTTSQKESKEILKKSRSQFSELDQAYY
ncbi:transcriptional regulator, partial [Acinetobacter baumannii]